MYITIKTIDVNYLITNLLHVENQLLSLPSESMLTVVREVKLVSIPKVFALSVQNVRHVGCHESVWVEPGREESRLPVWCPSHDSLCISPLVDSHVTQLLSPLDATHIMDPGCTLQRAVPPLWTQRFHCQQLLLDSSGPEAEGPAESLPARHHQCPQGKDCSGAAIRYFLQCVIPT